MRKFTLEFLKDRFNLYYITDPSEAKTCILKLENSPCKLFGLDLETARAPGYENYANPLKRGKAIGPKPGLDPHLSEIRLIQLFDNKSVYVFDAFKVGFRFAKAFLQSKRFIAHNGTFEIKQLTYNGFPGLNIHCSMLMSILVDRAENSPYQPAEEDLEEEETESAGAEYKKMKGFGLDAMMAKLFEFRLDKHFQTSDWNADELSSEQICYAGLDAVSTYRIGKLLYPKIKNYEMLKIYNLLKDSQHAIAAMELNGFHINKKIHRVIVDKWTERKIIAENDCRKYFKTINMNSSIQMGKWLEKRYQKIPGMLDRWPKAPSSIEKKVRYSFNAGKIALFAKDNAIAAYLAFKKIDKLLNTYGETLILQRHPKTKNIHCSFSLGETRTGRLSSFNPNLQNIPRVDKKETGLSLRHAFTAPKGWRFVVADYSQIEMRVAAELSRDKTMLRAYRTGVDLHKSIVAAVTGKRIDKVEDAERQLGKAINFGLLFGMGAEKLRIYARISYGVKMSDYEANNAFTNFHYKLYPGYSDWCERQRDICRDLGFVRTPMGKMRKLLEGELYTRAINTPVQGGASEVNLCALKRLNLALKSTPQIKLIMSIHDEIILLAEESLVKAAEDILRLEMQAGMLDVFPYASLKDLVEVNSGSNWHDAKNGKKTILEEIL